MDNMYILSKDTLFNSAQRSCSNAETMSASNILYETSELPPLGCDRHHTIDDKQVDNR